MAVLFKFTLNNEVKYNEYYIYYSITVHIFAYIYHNAPLLADEFVVIEWLL